MPNSVKRPQFLNKMAAAAILFLTMVIPGAVPAAFSADDSQNFVNQNLAPCSSWLPPVGQPKSALLAIHGLGLYSRSWADFGRRMARRGVAVYAIDVRGFGSWMNAAGHSEVDFNACLQDVKTALQAIRQANPGVPVFLLGESMGGAIAIRAASMYPELIDGLISSVPAGDRFQQRRTDLKVALELLKGPNKQFDIGRKIVAQATTNKNAREQKADPVNEKLRQDWQRDPLNRMTLSSKELIQFQRFMNDNHDCVKQIKTLPVLFVQGIDDALVRPDGTWELFKELQTPDRTLVALSSEHLIFEEAQDNAQDVKDQSVQLLLGWMSGTTVRACLSSAGEGNGAQPLSVAVAKIAGGQYGEARGILERLVQTEPDNADVHFWLGVVCDKMQNSLIARRELRAAMRLGHAPSSRQQVNDYLLSQAQGSTNSNQAASLSDPSTDSVLVGLTGGRPAVVAFYASWVDQCDKLEKMLAEAATMFGDRLKIVKVDVDDQNNDSLIKTFNVGPIPTLIFLTADGKVSSTSIGQSGMVNFARSVSGIVR